MVKVKADTAEDVIESVFAAVGGLKDAIEGSGILEYTWGKYASPEGLGRGHTHGFCMKFTTAEARDAYLPHPEHQKVADKVKAITEGGIDGILAFDYTA